jgi:uncharacterized protein (DUF1778 family)
MATDVADARRRRQGSEQRQRQRLLAARVNAEEERRIRRAADAEGVSVAAFIRQAVLTLAGED